MWVPGLWIYSVFLMIAEITGMCQDYPDCEETLTTPAIRR